MIESPSNPPILNARRLPTDDEMARQAANTRDTFRPGDLVLKPAMWGTTVLIVGNDDGEHHGLVEIGLPTREPDGRFTKGHPFSGTAPASALIRVCRHCLHPDLAEGHPPACGPAASPEPNRVPITATDISSGETTFYVDLTDNDNALVIVDIAGHDVVGLDLNAGTVGIWVGDDPDNREWTVVDRFTPPTARTSTTDEGDRHRFAPSGSTLADAVVAAIPHRVAGSLTTAKVLADAAELPQSAITAAVPPHTDEPFALPDCGA